MKVIDVSKLPLYEADPPFTRQNKIVVDEQIGARGASMGIGIYRPGERAEMHVHPEQEEIIYFTRGHGRITLESGEVVHVRPHVVTYIPAGERHLLENVGDENLEFIFVYSPPGPERGIRRWKVVA